MSALTPGLQATWLALDANPITQPVQWLVNGVAAYFHQLQPGSAFAHLAISLAPRLTPGAEPWKVAGRSPSLALAQCQKRGSPGCAIQTIRGDLGQIGVVVLAVVLLARLARLGARGEFRSPQHVVFDLFPRTVGGLFAMWAAGPILTGAIKLAALAALVLDTLILSVALGSGPLSVARLGGTADTLILVAIPLYLTVGFLFTLIEVAVVGLLLLGMMAPILIPLALYGEQARIGAAWFRAVGSCLLILVVGPVGVAASIALVLLFNTVPVFGIVSGALIGEAGLLATAVASFVLAKSAFSQTRDSFRLTLEAVHLGALGDLPGQVVNEVRTGIERGAQVAMGVARVGAGDPTGAVQAGAAMSTALQMPPPGQASSGAPSDAEMTATPLTGPPDGGEDGAHPPENGEGGRQAALAVPGRGGSGLSNASFLAYCAVQVRVENGRAGPLRGLSDLLEGRGGRPRVSINQVQQLYAQYLADRPPTNGSGTTGLAA